MFGVRIGLVLVQGLNSLGTLSRYVFAPHFTFRDRNHILFFYWPFGLILHHTAGCGRLLVLCLYMSVCRCVSVFSR